MAADFSRVVPGTVLGWLTDGAPPKGEAQIRMMYYLHLRGADLEELSTLPQPAFDLGLYISLGVIELDDALRQLNYAGLKDLYRLLRGGDLTSARAELLMTVLANYANAAEDAARTASSKFTSLFEDAPSSEQVRAPTKECEEAPRATSPKVPFPAEHTAGTLLTTAALVESLILTDESHLAFVRELVGEARILDLVAHLQSLVDDKHNGLPLLG